MTEPIPKQTMVKKIEDFQADECAIYAAGVITEMEHAGLQIQLNNLKRRVEMHECAEYKVE